MAFKGQVQVRSKIAIDNNLIEQVYSLKSLGNLISYEKELAFDTNVLTVWKLQALQTICLDHGKLSR